MLHSLLFYPSLLPMTKWTVACLLLISFIAFSVTATEEQQKNEGVKKIIYGADGRTDWVS